MTERAIEVGSRVRLTARFLRATGQYVGDGPHRVWTVLAFSGPWAVVNQETDTSRYTSAELDADPTLALRRIAVGNLERVKT